MESLYTSRIIDPIQLFSPNVCLSTGVNFKGTAFTLLSLKCPFTLGQRVLSSSAHFKEKSMKWWEPSLYASWDSVPSSLQLHHLHPLLWYLPSSCPGHMGSTSVTFMPLLHTAGHSGKLTIRNRALSCVHKAVPSHPLFILYG